MKYAVMFAVFVAFVALAGPNIIERIIFKTPYESDIHKEIMQDVNKLRAGQKELAHDVRLDCAAQAHADDMAARRICTIIGRNGETPRDRLESCGLGEFSEVVELIVCNENWDFTRIMKEVPDYPKLLKMDAWRYIGVGVRDNTYVIYLTF
jgi:uncharacterized protein YkwD